MRPDELLYTGSTPATKFLVMYVGGAGAKRPDVVIVGEVLADHQWEITPWYKDHAGKEIESLYFERGRTISLEECTHIIEEWRVKRELARALEHEAAA